MKIDFTKQPLQFSKPNTDFESGVVDFVAEWLSDSDEVQVKTSGSTGIPKILKIQKKRLSASAEKTCDFLGLKVGDTSLVCLPLEYISGKMMVVRSVARKLILHVANLSTKPLVQLNSRIDFCAMTPLQVENSLDKLHLIRKLIIGGAAVSESLQKKIHDNLTTSDSEIFETYGMSETLSHIALKKIFPVQESFFEIFPGIEIDVDSRNCLKIFAPDLNQEHLQTNDIVELIDSKRFRFIGRADNVINTAGAKVFPEELENFVKKHLPLEVIFSSLEDDIFGQKLIAVIEGDSSEESRKKVLDLPYEKSFQKPKEIIFFQEIPRTPNGKVDRLKVKYLLQ